MKKRGILLLTCAALIVSTSNVYGDSFNAQSPGMDIFNTFDEYGWDKQEIDLTLGQSKGSEELFHAVYDYSLGGVDGELKVRYNDAFSLMTSQITNDIGKYTQVGRLLWKANEEYCPEIYTYQIESLGDLNYDFGLDAALETFKEVPTVIDTVKPEDDVYSYISYAKYPMFGETGTLMLAFKNNKIRKNNSWTFKLPEGKTFSDYSELICKSWLVTVSDIADSLEKGYSDDYSENEFWPVRCMRKICDYYQQAFQKENKGEMKKFDSALRNFYLMIDREEGKFSGQINECLDEIDDNLDKEKSERIADRILEIWKNSDKCEYRWEQIAEQGEYRDSQPVDFDKYLDENLKTDNSKYIEVYLSSEYFGD